MVDSLSFSFGSSKRRRLGQESTSCTLPYQAHGDTSPQAGQNSGEPVVPFSTVPKVLQSCAGLPWSPPPDWELGRRRPAGCELPPGPAPSQARVGFLKGESEKVKILEKEEVQTGDSRITRPEHQGWGPAGRT